MKKLKLTVTSKDVQREQTDKINKIYNKTKNVVVANLYNGELTKRKLIELLKDVSDDTRINVLNKDGQMSADVEFWFDDLEKLIEVTGLNNARGN